VIPAARALAARWPGIALGVLSLVLTVGASVPSAAQLGQDPVDSPTPTLQADAPGPLDASFELDARAAAIVAIRPTDLGDGFALMDLLSGIFPGFVGAFDRARDSVGLYSFSRGELGERGVDPDALVLLSWGQIDADDWTARRRRGKSSTAPLVWARHRVVVKIGQNSTSDSSDVVKLENAFAEALRKRGATIIRLPRLPHTPALPAWMKTVASTAKHASVHLVARTPDGDLLSLRTRDGRAVIDWAEPWAGKARLTDDLGRVFTKMVAPPRRRLSDELMRQPRPLLSSAESSVAAVISPAAIALLAPHATCRDDWSAGEGALMDEAALLLRMHPFDWKLEIVWTLTALGKNVFDGLAADDGLADGRAIVHDGLAAGALLISSFDAIAGVTGSKPLPHDRLARGLEAMRGTDIGCGMAGPVAAIARYWPQLVHAVAEEALPRVLATPLDARPRNLVALLGDPASRATSPPRSWIDTLTYFVSFPQSATTALEQVLGTTGTKGERQTFGDRTPRFFDFGSGARFEEAGLESLAGGHVGLAIAPPGSGLGWYYRMHRRAAHFGAQSNVGFLHVNVARLLGKFAADADSGTQAAVKLAASQFGLLGGNLTRVEDTLHLDLTLSPP
jgi:hypothetical protein